MRLLVAAGVSLLAFIAIDAIWLGLIARDLYATSLAHLLAEQPRRGPIVVFYLLYVTGMAVLVLRPALASGSWRSLLGNAAVLGLLAYGTYDLTNWATLKDWPATVVAADLLWGMIVTSSAAACGYAAARAVA